MRPSITRMRRWGSILLAAAFLSSLLIPSGSASVGGDRIARSAVNESLRVIVEFQNSPLADSDRPGQAGRIATEQQQFRASMRGAGIAYRELNSFQKLFNGMTLVTSARNIGQIKAMHGVKAVHLSRKTDMPSPALFSSTTMIGADKAWAGDPSRAIPGVDGSGVTVAIIDTGVDYSHPDLGGCLGPDCRVIAGYDLVGDTFDGTSDPVPDDDPMDQQGHGTHVTGIIGANAASASGVTGVAPGVNFVALKVFGPVGSTYDDIILQALEMAYTMKVDVINLSLGSAFAWPNAPTAQAVTRLTQKGIFVAAAAGNNGPFGEYAVGAPAVGSGAIAAGSFENDNVQHPAFLTPDGTPIGYEPMVESPAPPNQGESAELVYTGLGLNDSDFQNPDGSSKVAGKVALIQRGQISFQEKSQRAQQFGAAQVIIFNNVPGFFLGTLGTPGDYIPTVGITKEDGERLLGLMNQGPVTVTWTDRLYLFRNPTAGRMSDFSSWGPAPNLAIKPDLTAPGGSIYSTVPVAMGGYATYSGTSMASPHVAGAAALLLQARREMFKKGAANVKATAIRTLLLNTAIPRTEGPDSDTFYPVHLQGAGMIDVWGAITAKQRVAPDKLELGPMAGGASVEESIGIENLGDEPESYTFQAIGAESPAVTVSAAREPLTVQARATGKVKVDIAAPTDLPDGQIFSGWILVNNEAGETVARIPYLGFKGDYQAASALDPIEPLNLPWLAWLDGIWLYKASQVEIHPYCGCDADSAWILFSFARPVEEFRMEIWDESGQHKWGNVTDVKYLSRSAGGIEVITWSGMNDKGRQVPAGNYRLRLMLLRPLGNPYDESDWDLWTSGPITVVY